MKFRYLLPAPFLALLLLGGPTSPARAGTLPPVSLTATAVAYVTAAPGQQGVATWYVADSGADALRVTMTDSESPYSFMTNPNPAAGWAESLSPATLTLASGQSENVAVTFSVPKDAVPGTTYYWSVTASASDAACSGNCLGAAVAGWLEITVT